MPTLILAPLQPRFFDVKCDSTWGLLKGYEVRPFIIVFKRIFSRSETSNGLIMGGVAVLRSKIRMQGVLLYVSTWWGFG